MYETGETYRYSKAKQVWLFWGLAPLGRTNVNTPEDGSCEIITRRSFGDVLISSLTLGLVTTYTIKVKDKKKNTEKVSSVPTSDIDKKTTVTVTVKND